jgi:hypothetical protein
MPTRGDPYTVRDPPTVEWHRSQTPIDHPSASVTTTKIADGAVTTAKIADGAVTAAKLATLDYATLSGLTADPSLAAGRVWFRSDLGLLSYSPDGSTVRRVPYGTINVDAHASRHAAGGADPIPARGISRSMLEYPTVDVLLQYLHIIGKATLMIIEGYTDAGYVTTDDFADKAVGDAAHEGGAVAIFRARLANPKNSYFNRIITSATTADHDLLVIIDGTSTRLAYEAVDLPTCTWYSLRLECAGSTIKSVRAGVTISATDTCFAAGRFGHNFYGHISGEYGKIQYPFLRAPSSSLPAAVAILESEVSGSGTSEDPYGPTLSSRLVPVTAELPSFLYREARKYEMLKSKGFTEEEMELLLGYVPQHQVDLDAVTWGAFEFHPDKAPSGVVVFVYGDNPYRQGAIQRQAEHAKKKGLRAFDPPRNYGEAVALYNKLRSDFPHWLAGKDNFAYMCLGWEELDAFQNVDFYYGELLEHKTHYDQLKRVDPKEIESRLLELKAKLEKMTVLPKERDKHLRKVEELLKKGW